MMDCVEDDMIKKEVVTEKTDESYLENENLAHEPYGIRIR